MDLKVSVIIANYNYGDYIKQCIESVLNQTYKNIELIVVDDCSTDNSVDIIKQYSDVILIQNYENIGVCKSRKKGAEISTGDYIVFVDSDDYLNDNLIEIYVETLDVFSDCSIVYCDYADFRDNQLVELVNRLEWSDIYHYCSAAPWSMFKRECFDRFKNTFNFHRNLGGEDWDFWVTLAQHGYTAYHIKNYLFNRRLHNRNISYHVVDTMCFPFIILRHPECYSISEYDYAINYVKENHTEYLSQEWIKPVKEML